MSDASPGQLLIVLTGPSGVGKDAVFDAMLEAGVPIERPATMTTRAPRDGEREGVHHLFVGRDAFRRHVEAGDLLESAEVYGNLYGLPRASVRRALATGRHVLVRVDVQGAETLSGVLPDALFISLEPESLDVLRRHLTERGSESPEEIEERLRIAAHEMERAREFCRPIVNIEGDLGATVAAVRVLLDRESVRADRAPVHV